MQPQDNCEEFNLNYLLELCKAVIPKTWSVYKYCDIKNKKMGRGILNNEIYRHDNEVAWESNSAFYTLKALGTADDIIYYLRNGNVIINIHCCSLDHEPFVLLHELAHVAVMRRESFVTKTYKSDYGRASGTIIEDEMHGEIFLTMLNIFKNRAIKNGYKMFADYEIEAEGRFIDEIGNEH